MPSSGRLTRLSTRITLGALIVVVVGGVALLYLLGKARLEVEVAHQSSTVTQALHHNGEQLRHVIATLRQDVLFLAETPPIQGIVRAESGGGYDAIEESSRSKWERRLQEIFSAFSSAHPEYFLIRLIDNGGREIVRVDTRADQEGLASSNETQLKSERDFLLNTLAIGRGKVQLSEFYHDPDHERIEKVSGLILQAATPIYSRLGDRSGLLVISMAADGMFESLNQAVPEGAEVYVTNASGDYLLHPSASIVPNAFGNRGIKQEFPELMEIFNPEASEILLPQEVWRPVGSRHVAATRVHFDPQHPERFLGLVYAVPEIVMSGKIYESLDRETIVGGILAILLASTIVWLSMKRIFEPLSELTWVARRIADGNRSLTLPSVSQGEVGDLVLAIRSMLESIDAREKDLRIAASTFETQEAIMIMDTYPRILRVNQSFTTITGYGCDEVRWMSPRILVPDRLDSPFYEEMWDSLQRTGKWSGRLWSRRKNGETFPRWQTTTAVSDESGTVTHYVSIFSDISEQVRSESEIRRLAGEMKRQNEVLQLYKSKMEEEREVARGLMQQFSSLDTINDPAVRFHMRPMDEFSGDLVAAARTPDGRLHVLLADGTGHGLNAALSVTPLAQLFYQMTRKGFDITSIAAEMNQRVRSYLPLPRYVAAVLLSVETDLEGTDQRRTLRVWNGGCPAVLLYSQFGEGVRRFNSRHLPMGIVGRESFDNSVEYFETDGQGEQILLCSDGLTELPTASGKQLGDSSRLYRPGVYDNRFDDLLRMLDRALMEQVPTDDITLMLVDLPALQTAQSDGAKKEQNDKAHLLSGQIKEDWRFALTLTAAQLKRLDTVPLLLNVASQFEESRIDGKLFVVLAELFNNALDHGLLKLNSALKNGENGMEAYFEERALRLAALEQGWIEIRLEKLIYEQNGGLRINFRDSGDGFDHEHLARYDSQARHGRGVTLLRNLCNGVEYIGDGSEVVAVLPI